MPRTAEPLPLPPPNLRALVGAPEPELYRQPSGELVYPYLPTGAYDTVLDFGCGCGRVARRLIQQQPQPGRYLGLDLHQGMVTWCQQNLTPHAPSFRFEHHDVHNVALNPGGRDQVLPLPAADGSVTLVNAISVFTHLTQEQAEHYLREAARVLTRDGYLHASWFLFDKQHFAMMQPAQNALYTDAADLSAAVIFDRSWVREVASAAGLTVTWAKPGFQWLIVMRPSAPGRAETTLTDDGTTVPPWSPPEGWSP